MILPILQRRFSDLFLELPHKMILIVVAAVQSDLVHLEIRMCQKLHCLVHPCCNHIVLDAGREEIPVQPLQMAFADAQLLCNVGNIPVKLRL